ncbi:MAG: SpoIVB peptidase S55 domain-containing protein [Acidobacteriota bacterium]
MNFKILGIVLALIITTPAMISAQSADFYPLELVKPGQQGYGRTIFKGTTVENFDVEVLGVLENVGPKQNLILARLSGEKLEETGVFAGMSGSPVYIDGKLVGAVAYAFKFAKAPIAGITPIQEMVDIFKESPKVDYRKVRYDGPGAMYQAAQFKLSELLPQLPSFDVDPFLLNTGSLEGAGKLTPIATPLNLSGFSPAAIRSFAPQLKALGLTPIRGIGSGKTNDFLNAPLEPGSTISVQMVRGDMEVSASGTVTHLSGDKIYAFGHPFLSMGYTDMPLNKAAVLTIIPNLMNSEKVSATTASIGSIKQDRATGIMGIVGEEADMIPIGLKIMTSRNELKEYNYEVITDQFLTPFLMTFTVHNSIIASERAIGGQTLEIKCKIAVRGQPDVHFENSVSDLVSTPVFAAMAASSPINFLLSSGFEDLEMERIDVEITAVEQTREATLEKVWQDKLEARPGEEVNLTVFLRRANGDTIVEEYPVMIPEDITPGPLRIMVGDGLSLIKVDAESDVDEFVPKSLQQLIKAINNLKKNDRLYIRLFREGAGVVAGGEGLPDLPPSLLALYNSQKTGGALKAIDKVIYFEYELPPTDFVLTGQHVIKIKVKG